MLVKNLPDRYIITKAVGMFFVEDKQSPLKIPLATQEVAELLCKHLNHKNQIIQDQKQTIMTFQTHRTDYEKLKKQHNSLLKEKVPEWTMKLLEDYRKDIKWKSGIINNTAQISLLYEETLDKTSKLIDDHIRKYEELAICEMNERARVYNDVAEDLRKLKKRADIGEDYLDRYDNNI